MLGRKLRCTLFQLSVTCVLCLLLIWHYHQVACTFYFHQRTSVCFAACACSFRRPYKRLLSGKWSHLGFFVFLVMHRFQFNLFQVLSKFSQQIPVPLHCEVFVQWRASGFYLSKPYIRMYSKVLRYTQTHLSFVYLGYSMIPRLCLYLSLKWWLMVLLWASCKKNPLS